MDDLTVEEMRARLEEAERKLAEAEALRKQNTPIVEIFKIECVVPNRYNQIMDPTCVMYNLSRTIGNYAEAEDAGHEEYKLREGSQNYLYNTSTMMIVCAVGGGTSYVNAGIGDEKSDSHLIAFKEIGDFIAASGGEGGDVTQIVKRHLARVFGSNPRVDRKLG